MALPSSRGKTQPRSLARTHHPVIPEDPMTTQTLATGTAENPINFENYALLYDELTAAQADLDEETCRLPVWCIFPDDQELGFLWTEVISAGRSLAEFLDASDEKYSLPTSPA